jgi:excinuclease ABC subunit C
MPQSEINLVAERIKALPVNPGVYLMKNARGDIIYVGKASCLRDRVNSYFRGNPQEPKTADLVRHIHDLEYYITGSEEEALLLELNLIKRHRPHYNIRLKDDKGYPYIKIDLSEEWPRVQITRHVATDKARYFGPFASGWSIRQALEVVKDIFPYRTCDSVLDGKRSRPCLEHDMHHCGAPCTGLVSRDEYLEAIKGIIQFLEGRQAHLEKGLIRRMKEASATRQYELAAHLRDQLRAMRGVLTWQRAATRVRGDLDVIATVQERDQAYVQVYFIRGGHVLGKEGFVLQGAGEETPATVVTSFVQQYYAQTQNIPPLILTQYPVNGPEVLRSWLTKRRGGAVQLAVPRRGPRRELMATVAENARKGLEQLRIKRLSEGAAIDQAMAELKDVLNLPNEPKRIEGYDISNIQGKLAVGSMVVFESGRPKPALYRRFRIKAVPQADDYAMLAEVIRRRFARVRGGMAEGDWSSLPGLVLIDGGKGQLSAARQEMVAAGADSIPAIGLAKENEEIFLPGRSNPIRLAATSSGRQLLQRVRDEAHRFALGYHSKLRKHQAFASALDGIPGLGPARKKTLLKAFGSVAKIREASLADLAAVEGISPHLARTVKESI